MMIVSSEFLESDWQEDGSRTVVEKLVADDGQIYGFVWQGTANAFYVLDARRRLLDAQLAEKAAAENMVTGTQLPLTKFEFRSLFTLPERMQIDAFNKFFETNGVLSDTQKAMVRTGLLDFDAALNIAVPFLDSVVSMIGLYRAVGILTDQRAAAIIAQGGGDSG